MQRILFSALVVCCCALWNGSHAQSLAAEGSQLAIKGIATSSKPVLNQDWSIYVDEAGKTYFIDFEKFTVNISEVQVRNSRNEVIIADNVLDLPVNTIYELDFSNLPSDTYRIKLDTPSGAMEKEILVK